MVTLRRFTTGVAVVGLVAAVRVVLGVWPAAVAVAAVAVVGLVAGWALVEARASDRRSRPGVERVQLADHVAFARALTAVAAAYLAECERQEARR